MDINHPLLAVTTDDPPPFPPTHTQLRRLDRALVCQICKEFYQGPVTITCGHSFCSQCIRSSLDTLKKCPSCGETAGEGSIRRNRALEEIVDSWEEARAVMITLSQPLPQAGPSRKRPPARAESRASNDKVKRLKREDSAAASSRSESPVRRGSGMDQAAAINIFSSDGVNDEEDEEEVEEVEEQEEEVLLAENDEGECPICSAKLPIQSIPMHIERGCPPPKRAANGIGTGNQKADWKKVFGGVSTAKSKEVPLKRITKPNYHLATPAELRSILSTYSLPSTGDKPTLEARVQDWILLFNSNLDTSHPKSMPALRAKLAEVEASRKRDKEKDKEALGESLKTKDGVAKYVKERGSEFERLRKEILARKEAKAAIERGASAVKGRGQEGEPIEIE